jgi:chitodextrinase
MATISGVPQNLKATSITSNSVTLSWAAPGTPYYEVYKNNQYVGRSTSKSYTVAGLSPNTKYTFKVRAFNGREYSGFSNTITVTTSGVVPIKRDAVIYANDVTVTRGDTSYMLMNNVRAVDDGGYGKDITNKVIIQGTLNTAIVGQYYITYSVTGENGYTVSKQITITVVNNPGSKPPNPKPSNNKRDAVIYASDRNIIIGDFYTVMDNVRAVDDGGYGKDITNLITIKGVVNTARLGRYNITYSVKGENGNLVSKQVTITVLPYPKGI